MSVDWQAAGRATAMTGFIFVLAVLTILGGFIPLWGLFYQREKAPR